MTIRFLGTGDAFGSGGRLQSCTLVESPRARVLVDCGASALSAMRRHQIDPNTIDAVLLTHLHGDHFGGVPYLLMDAHYASARTTPLVVAGPAGLASRVDDLHEALFAGSSRLPVVFDLRYVELAAGEPIDIAGWSVSATPVAHSSHLPCLGLRLEAGPKALAFSGDTAWTEALVDLARNADLFLCECYGYDEAPPGHLDYRTLSAHRDRLTCRRLLLNHLGEEMLRRAPSLDIETAYDGLTITI